MHSAQELQWFKKPYGDKSLEEEYNSRPSEAAKYQVGAVTEAGPLPATNKAVKSSTWILQNWKQTGKIKRLSKWEPHSWWKGSYLILLNCYPILFDTTKNRSFLDCDLQQKVNCLGTTTDEQLSDRTKKPQSISQNHTVHKHWFIVTDCWPFSNLRCYGCLNPSETITFKKHDLQSDELHWEL